MKKPVWEVDETGEIIEHYLYSDDEITNALLNGRHIIDFPWNAPCFKPIFNFDTGKWIEGVSPEEIEEIARNQPHPEPTMEELQAENEGLKTRLDAAEMAIITLMDFM